jgi:hypothetical protein
LEEIDDAWDAADDEISLLITKCAAAVESASY